MSPSKAFFISVTVVFIFRISFWFFQKVSLSLFKGLSVRTYRLLLSISTLSVLIRVVFNSQPSNTSLFAIFASRSDAFSVSSNCVWGLLVCLLIFLLSLLFFWRARYVVPGERNCWKQAFRHVMVRFRGWEVPYRTAIRLLVGLCLGTVNFSGVFSCIFSPFW